MPSLPCGPFVGDDSGENSSEASVPEKASLRVPDVEGSVFVSPSETSSGAQSSSGGDAETPEVMDSRAYQLEMLKKSLEGNVIVAMDTGSGKTQIALLRIRAELERCTPEKIVWFIAPTVLLCSQQFDVIQLQIPSITAKLLTGKDQANTWSEPIWVSILKDTRIVVSTPQILHDALLHAFVKMEMLALLVFDEAHNCVGKAAGSKIMTDFYHPRKHKREDVPSILGLTASPSMTSKTEDMKHLETNLDARCVSPTIHRQELLRHVKKPQIYHIDYTLPIYPNSTEAMESLRRVYHELDIRDDPYVLKLVSDLTDRNRRLLVTAIEKHETYTQNQIKGLYSRSLGVARELGSWAADRYLWRAITEHLAHVDAEDDFFDKWASEEKRYLCAALRNVNIVAPPSEPTGISDKVRLLIQELLSAQESPVCIVFARERATVSALYEVLTACPEIAAKFRIGTVVGNSSYQGRKRDIYELASNITVELSALEKFRSGHLNLLIATSVLEEGIDVPACNLVICFDELVSFKAFVQRRGRARKRDSKLVLFFERSARITKQWEAVEVEMKRQYEDEKRELRRLEVLETDEPSETFFEVESTGAKIGLDEAKQHLEHFCRTLSHGEFVDARPDYIVHGDDSGAVAATVLLPAFLPEHIRQAESRFQWPSEMNATKDAAFQAYIALYHAGLVNDNLLPFKPEQIPGVEHRAPIAVIGSPFNPWKHVAEAWNTSEPRWAYTFTCYNENNLAMGDYDIILPVHLEQPRPIRIFRDYEIFWELRSSPGRLVSSAEVEEMPDHTYPLLSFHFGHRWQLDDKRHVIRVTAKGTIISKEHIGCQNLESAWEKAKNQRCLIRNRGRTPFLYQELLTSKPPAELVRHIPRDYELAPNDIPYVVLKKWTRRADFLHPLLSDPVQDAENSGSNKPYEWVLPVSEAKVDAIPLEHAQFGMLIPSIIHELEVMLVTKHLANTLLRPVGISNLALVREAISSGSANEPYNYERLELLGDSILKYCAAILAASSHPGWPEGYLSFFKDRLISNSRLSRACIEKGLAKYILTKRFTGHKWRPLYLDDMSRQDDGSHKDRKLSTKTLADVVEALIGAAYKDGGLVKACKCISVFIDEQSWPDIDECRQLLYKMQPETSTQRSILTPLEELIGYSFQKQSLLFEALTHASFVTGLGQRTLDRLEFIGDAVLDNIIVTMLFAVDPPLPHDQMHLLKTAMVNGDFLAFVSFETGLHKDELVVTDDLEVETKDVVTPLWKFMRHAMTAIGVEQAATAQRHLELRGDIRAAMETGTHYPWALLAKLQAKKFFSDVVEALLGAVWVDSGSLEVCKGLLDRLGITPYLERLIRDGVEVQHPKEVLGKCAVAETVRYEVEVVEKSNGGREFACNVHVGNRIVARVDGGVSKEEVKAKGATEAVRILTTVTNEMDLD